MLISVMYQPQKPYINKTIHMLLMLRFGTMNTLIPSHYFLWQLIRLSPNP